MSATNQFKAFSTGGGANALTPSDYAALTTLIANGFQSGVASSAQINTVLRQASFVAAAIAQIIANDGTAANDDGNLSTFVSNFLSSLTSQQGFLKSFGANGYQKLPGGLILQWGTVGSIVTSGDSNVPVTFPISFPNAVYGVYGNWESGNTSQNMGCYVNFSPTLSGASFCVDKNNVESLTIGLFWFAIGS